MSEGFQKEFQKYCRENNSAYYGLIGIVMTAAFLFAVAILGECY